jgi:DNA processing protein
MTSTPAPEEWPLGLAWLARAMERDLGRAARAAGGHERLWTAGPETLARLLRLDAAALERAVHARESFDADAERRRLEDAGIVHLGRLDPRLPGRLGQIYDPPPGLFLRGTVAAALARLAEGPAIAVVGSRRATAPGLALARALGRELAARGGVVVSGLARGIDGAAHLGAVEGGGTTVAVLGTGVDVVYPRRNRDLARRLADDGLLASEYWPGTPAAPWHFPARNRILAGLSEAVVVVEAGRRSGALITADFALEAGRPVLAVPGIAGSEAAAGCHALIRAGAALCETADDVQAELPDAPWESARPASQPKLVGLQALVYHRLAVEPLRADQLACALSAPVGSVAAALARLEVEGLVIRGEQQRFWATPRLGAA